MLGYAIMPVIGAFIGYITNLIAVKMLFHPKKEVDFFGIKIQGVIPRRQRELARAVAQALEKEILNSEILSSAISSEYVEKKLEKIAKAVKNIDLGIPLLGGAISQKIQDYLMELVRNNSDLIVQELKKAVEQGIDIGAVVEERISTMDVDTLERVAVEVAGKELKYITYFGGVLGFIVGLVQVGMLYLID